MVEKIKKTTSGSIQKIKGINWKEKKTRRVLIIAGSVALVLILAGSGFAIFRNQQASTSTASSDSYQTAVARRGTLTISASGSGTLVGGNSTSLAFPIAGVVKKLYVTEGEQVTEGQALADLVDTRILVAAVAEAEGNLAAAQKTREDLAASSDGNLATAKLALVTAQISLNDAKNKVLTWVSHRGSDTMIDSADSALAVAKVNLDRAQEFFDRFKSKAAKRSRSRGSREPINLCPDCLQPGKIHPGLPGIQTDQPGSAEERSEPGHRPGGGHQG